MVNKNTEQKYHIPNVGQTLQIKKEFSIHPNDRKSTFKVIEINKPAGELSKENPGNMLLSISPLQYPTTECVVHYVLWSWERYFDVVGPITEDTPKNEIQLYNGPT